MRVLLLSPHYGSGGITRWTGHILTYYHKHLHEIVELDLLPMDSKPILNMFMRMFCGIWNYSKVIILAFFKLNKHQYDVMHVCTSGSISFTKDIILLFMAKRFHVRTVLHLHYGRIPEIIKANNWEWKLLQRAMVFVDVCVTMNKSSYEALKSAGFKDTINIPNPLAPEVEIFVEEYGKSGQRDETMIFFAGFCLKTKGVYELVKACKKITGIRLVLAGLISEDVKADLEAIAGSDLKLEILGEILFDEVLLKMMECGIFVLPSYTEGFPNVILESMACGCAIIATTVGAIPEMIGEENGEKFGLLIPPKDTEALKMAICQLLDDTKLKENCRKNSKRRVKKYNMESVWKDLIHTWESACKN